MILGSMILGSMILGSMILGSMILGSMILGSMGGMIVGDTELAGLRHVGRQRLLDRVTHEDPAAGRPWHGAFDQDQPALDIGLHDPQVERRDAVDAHVTGHLLVLEGLAGVLAAAGGTVRAMRNRDAVGGAQTAEVPALHRPGEPLAGRGAGDVDELTDQEMIGRDLGADRQETIFRHAELRQLHLRLDIGDREATTLGLRDVLHLGMADAELDGRIAVHVHRAMRDDLTAVDLQDSDGHMLAGVLEHPRHPHLLCDNT